MATNSDQGIEADDDDYDCDVADKHNSVFTIIVISLSSSIMIATRSHWHDDVDDVVGFPKGAIGPPTLGFI